MKTHTIFHYSCVKYRETRLKHQLNSWPKRLPSTFESIPMTGSGKDQYDGDILRLDVKDDYKSLVYKTKKMFEWYLDNCSTEWIIKVDDDVWLSDAGIETLQNDKSPYSGCYLLQYKKIHIIGGAVYKIHRQYLERLITTMSDKIDTNPPEDVHVGVSLSNLGLKPVGLFPSNKRCIWPTAKKTSQTQFGLCDPTKHSLEGMYKYFDSGQEVRYLNIPSGKSVKDAQGLYSYNGPRVLMIHRKLILEDVFDDGTPIIPFYSNKDGRLLTNKENPSN